MARRGCGRRNRGGGGGGQMTKVKLWSDDGRLGLKDLVLSTLTTVRELKTP